MHGLCQFSHPRPKLARIFRGTTVRLAHTGHTVMPGGRYGIADDDHPLDKQRLNNGHHGGFLTAGGIP